MTDIEKAKLLFEKSGLAFPNIPDNLEVQLKERKRWLFSTREIQMSPYDLRHYVDEADESHLADYVVLTHSGHGINSYAIQYYVVLGFLRMFLNLGWGGVYMDSEADAAKIRRCFSFADNIIEEVQTTGLSQIAGPIKIVCSDFYGSYWSALGEVRRSEGWERIDPAAILLEVFEWIQNLRKI